MSLKPGVFYSDKLLEKSIENILGLYEESGFPYCQIDPEDFQYTSEPGDSTGWLAFKLKITEGPRLRIGKVEFTGEVNTKEKILQRIIGIDSTGYFSQKRLETGLAKLRRASFIKKIKGVELVPQPDPAWAVLQIELEEKTQNSFLGVLGYVPPVQSRSGYFSGKLDFVFDNIFGTGKRAEIAWSKKDPYSFDLFFSFREPYLLNLPLSWGLDLRQVDYDSSYSKLDLNTSLDYSPLERFSFGLSGGWERVTSDERLKAILPSSRKYKFGFGLSLDLLDYPANPGKGLYYKARVIYGRKKYFTTPGLEPEKTSAHEARLLLDMDNFLPLYKNQVMALSFHLRSLTGSEKKIPVPDQFTLGGLNSLRGYREEEFSGDKLFWSNIEYRFLLNSESRIFLFWDFGYFSRRLEDSVTGYLEKISDSRSGFGLGLKIDTRIGIYEVDYALGQNDRLSEGKIHFGISNRF
jgi:outer membrane protein assembly factor BamA